MIDKFRKNLVTIVGAATLLIELIQSVVVARILGVEGFGTVAVTLTIFVIGTSLLGLRSGDYVHRYVNLSTSLNKLKILIIYGIDIFSSIIVFLIFTNSFNLLSKFFPLMNYDLYFVLTFLILSKATYGVSEALLIAANRVNIFIIVKFLVTAIGFGIVFFLSNQYREIGYSLAITINSFVLTIVLVAINYYLVIVTQNLGSKTLKGFLNFTMHSFFNGSLKAVISSIDILIVGSMFGAAQAGNYKVAKTLSQAPNGLYNLFWQRKIGQVSKTLDSKNYIQLKMIIRDMNLFLLPISMFTLLLVFLFKHKILYMIYGPTFVGGAYALVILLAGNLVIYSIAPYSRLFYAKTNNFSRLTLIHALQAFCVLSAPLFVSSIEQVALFVFLGFLGATAVPRYDVYKL